VAARFVKSAGKRARAWLEDYCYKLTRQKVSRCMSIHAMARECGVSKSTMCSAVRSFAQQGRLFVVPRGGVFCAPPGNINPPEGTRSPGRESRAHPRFTEIADRIGEAIIDGSYPSGRMLPRRKELCAAFGVSYRTIALALQQLCDEKRIEPFGRGFRPVRPGTPVSNGCIVQIGSSSFIENRSRAGGQISVLLPALEEELRKAAITCYLAPYESVYRQKPSGTWVLTLPHIEKKTVLGCLVFASTLPHCDCANFYRLCAQLRIPVVVIDETGYRTRDIAKADRDRITIFDLATSEEPGRRMGQFLSSCGHRTVAWFSPAEREPWALHRLHGLQAVLGKQNVRVYTAGRYWFDYALTDRTRRFVSEKEKKLRTRARNLLREIGLRYPDEYQLPCPDLYPVFAPIIRHRFDPHFQDALTDGECSAWITANDVTGLAALDFLHEYAVAVPGHLSVVSFDNSYQAFARELTSYNYGEKVLAKTIIDTLLHPHGIVPGPAASGDRFGALCIRNSVRAIAPGGDPLPQPFSLLP